ncbi:NAD(P)-dependent oxidoreductase [Tellurirhabdus rosea]|uniref:NAD(P)-dependent oxidoreductase n=1 Tax=Tellurirhabdus rosea TaxID=2674997 RepID=UPI002257CFCC|nr:SDR family oxidoreductase [Tellurirhabdus rosea]
MKKIALFGASGKTGQQFLNQALAKGYQIKALVRNPQAISQQSPNLQLIRGDVLNPQDVERTVEDTDLVVSLFGHVKGSPEWLQTRGTENIISSMKTNGLKRIISLSGGGLPFEKDQPKFADKMIRTIMKIAVPKVLNDAVRHAEVLKASGLEWIIVRGPRLTDGEKRNQYRVGWVGVDASTQISRADLADFILNQVEDSRFVGQMPFVSY